MPPGITKSSTAKSVLPEFVTLAVIESPIVIVPIEIDAAVPVSPLGPCSPVAPVIEFNVRQPLLVKTLTTPSTIHASPTSPSPIDANSAAPLDPSKFISVPSLP